MLNMIIYPQYGNEIMNDPDKWEISENIILLKILNIKIVLMNDVTKLHDTD